MATVKEMAPSIGTLTDRVQLRRRETWDGRDLFVPVSTVWARVRSTAGKDFTHSVVVRYRTDISTGDRIVYRGRNLDVVSTADHDGKRLYLVISATEASHDLSI